MTDLSMNAGTSLLLDILVTNEDGTVRDITDAMLSFEVYLSPRKQLPDPEDDSSVVLSGSAEVVDGDAGTAAAYLVAEDTEDWPFRVLYYEVLLIEDDSTTSLVDSGKLTVSP
jgi:hypothetical protein